MIIQHLTLANFRSYDERAFALSPDVTMLVGQNGVGKTNILEAIYTVLYGKSFRDSDEQLIRYDQTWWKIVAELEDNTEREVRYQVDQTPSKQLIVDGVSKGRFTYKHQLPVVLFEPDHLALLHASPSKRREYLDTLLQKLEPSYRTTLAKYERALLQRNNLLKKHTNGASLRDTVFVWDIALAEYGSEIIRTRQALVDTLNERLSAVYSELAGTSTTLLVSYEPPVRHSAELAHHLTAKLQSDVLRGFTSVGPHRDDIDFLLDGRSAKQTASRGEVRTIILALKQIEVQLLTERHSTPPLFLLDDVFSELDSERQKALLSTTEKIQKIITTTHAPKGCTAYLLQLE